MYFLLNSVRVDYRITLLLLAGAVSFLFAFGVFGVMKSAPFGDDFSVFYRAGSFFLNGSDPWYGLVNSGTPFSYPPHSLTIVGLYALLDFDIARIVHTVFNFVSIFVIAYFANHYFLKIDHFRNITIAQLLPLCLLIGNPYMATSIHQGQLTLPAIAAVLLSWHFVKGNRHILAGVFLCLATIKPSLSILYVVWLMLTGNFLVLFIGGGLSVLMIIPGAIVLGPVSVFISWLESMSGYSDIAINQPGAPYVVGFESFFAAYGVDYTGFVFRPLILISLLWVFFKRHLFDDTLLVVLLFTITFTFLYAHDYDYAAVVMLFSYCLFLSLSYPSIQRIAVAGVLIVLFFIPQRIFREIDLIWLHHTRTFLLPLCLYLVYKWSQSEDLNVRHAAQTSR